jgi:hypothetical protein
MRFRTGSVRVRVTDENRKNFGLIAHSEELGDALEAVAAPVLEQARRDTNAYYVATLRMKRFHTSGRRGRVVIQIGAAPIIGGRVEAKRGTLARAIRRAG